MREILFKAKRIDNGEWVQGYYVYNPILDKHFIYHRLTGELVNVDENTLCQSTGLTDKKGNRIWENDIVSEDWDAYEGVIRFGEFDTQTLKNIGFNIEWEKEVSYRQDLLYWAEKVEVVGNIFDNSERLEGGAV